MRRFLVLAMLCAATVSAAADAPFALNADIPDYVVTAIEHSAAGTKQASRTVAHHADWTRVDTTEDGHKTTTYFARNGSLEIRAAGDGVDEMYVDVRLHPKEIGWDTEPRNTGKRETFLDESCTVWSAGRSNSDPQLERLSCLTDDGIELWSRFVSKYGVKPLDEATKVERRPVALGEVQPPQNLLVLGWWDNDEAKASLFYPDFEATLAVSDGFREATPDGSKQIIRTIRRHYPWTYEEDRAGGVLRRLTVSDASQRMRLWFVARRGDAESSLSIRRWPPVERSSSGFKPKDMNRSETILGEQCRWFDLMPGAADAGSAECRTDDGIPLKQSVGGMRSGLTLATAVSLTRRPLSLTDVKPPKDMLSLDWWIKEGHPQDR